MCVTCVLTVVSLMKSSLPISAFERPRASKRKTSRSRSLSSSSSCRRRRTWHAGELLDHASRDRRREERVSVGNRADRGDQLFGRVVLEDEAAGARPQRLVDVFVEVERREDQNPRAVVVRENAPGRLKAVELGHADVHQDDARMETRGLVDGFEPVARLGHDFDVLLAGEQHAKAGADHRLVVGDEHTDRHRSSWASGRRVLRTKPPSVAVPAVISPP